MTPEQTDLLQGTLDMMILKALALDEMHGLGISAALSRSRRERFRSSLVRSSLHCTEWKRKDGSPESGDRPKTIDAPSITA